MRIGIIGDIHGNLEALEAVLVHAKSEGVDRFVCTGDVVGYNANPHECLEIVRNLNCMAVVQGNHDYYASNTEMMLSFNPIALMAVKWTRAQLSLDERVWLRELPLTADVLQATPPVHFALVHGSMNHPQCWEYVMDEEGAIRSMSFQWVQLCFVGHTHVPVTFEQSVTQIAPLFGDHVILEAGNKYLINVGSVGQPRDCDPRACYATYDVERGLVRFHRVKYDIEAAQRKIYAAGLPPRCAERLSIGR